MIRIENPLIIFLLLVVVFVGVVVYPFLKTERFRLTTSKVIALLLVVGACVYYQTLWLAFAFLWPVSLIWFPEYWGNYTGFLRGPYIGEKSPPALVAAMGWFFLVIFPLILMWITGG